MKNERQGVGTFLTFVLGRSFDSLWIFLKICCFQDNRKILLLIAIPSCAPCPYHARILTMVDEERAIQLLGNGIAPVAVAATIGCDPSYISQLLMKDAVRDRVLAMRMETLRAQTERDSRIDKLEDAIIQKLEDLLPYITNVKQALSAFHLLNAAKRRGAVSGGDVNLTQNIVSINLPPVAKEYFFPKTNAAGEVVQVGEQVTVTKSLQSLMQDRLKERKAAAQDVQEITNGSSQERSIAAPVERQAAAA